MDWQLFSPSSLSWGSQQGTNHCHCKVAPCSLGTGFKPLNSLQMITFSHYKDVDWIRPVTWRWKAVPLSTPVHFQDYLSNCFPLHPLPTAVLLLPSNFFYDPLFFLCCFWHLLYFVACLPAFNFSLLHFPFLSSPLLCCFPPALLYSVLAEIKLARILIPESLSYKEQAPLKFCFAVFTVTQWYSLILQLCPCTIWR